MAKGLLFGTDSLSGDLPLAASSSATLAAAIRTASAIPSTTQRPTDGGGNGECKLLGSFALLIQGALGVLAISSLVWKRHRERPRRPLKIWGFDVSKQVVGSMLLHVANLLMSMLSAGQLTVKPVVADSNDDTNGPNPCSFYLLNLAIDVSIGALQTTYGVAYAGCFLDDHWHTNSSRLAAAAHGCLCCDAIWAAAGVDSIWQLWPSAKGSLVGEAVAHLFPGASWDEVMRVVHIQLSAVDRARRRLGPSVDRGQRSYPGRLRHAHLSVDHERFAVLHH